MNQFRPHRDFTIGKRIKEDAPPDLDGAVQGHIEGLLAQEILEGSDISFSFDDDSVQLTDESYMLISHKASELLRAANQENPVIPDLSKEISVKNMLISNACDIAAAHERAACNTAQADARRNTVTAEPEAF